MRGRLTKQDRLSGSQLEPAVRGSGKRLEAHEGGKEVIAMAKGKVTSARVARKASGALRDGRSSARTRSIAGSALAQAKSSRFTSDATRVGQGAARQSGSRGRW